MTLKQEKKHILVFSLAFKPLIGGAEVALFEIARRLTKYHFDIVTLRFSHDHLQKEDFEENITVWRVGWGGSKFDKYTYPFLGLYKALRLSKDRQFILCWSMMANLAGFAALFFKWLNPKIPFVLTLQEGDPKEHIKRRLGVMYLLWKFIFSSADAIQVISNYLGKLAIEEGALVEPKVVPNGVNVELFSQRNIDEENNLRQKLNINDNDFVVITTSRLVVKNGIDTLIRSAPIIHQKIPNLKLLILGTGPEEKNLRGLAAQLGILTNTMFLGDIEQGKIPTYLHISSVFVRPSRSEGLGNSFLEAMAAGVPIVGTMAGGIPDFLEDGATGLACNVEDENSLAEKVIFLFDNKDKKEKMVENAKSLISKSYEWGPISKSMDGIFEKVSQAKIAIATGIYPPDIGGPATYVASISQSLRQSGFFVKILTYSDTKYDRSRDVLQVLRKHSLPLRYFLYFLKLYKLSINADFIYAFDALSSGLPALLVSFLSGAPLVLRIGGDRLWEKKSDTGLDMTYREFYEKRSFDAKDKILFYILKNIVRSADLVIFSTDWQKDILSFVYNLDRNKVCVIRNSFNVVPEINDEKRESKYALFGGRIVKFKNLSRLLNVISDIKNDLPENFKFHIMGDGPEKNNIINLAKEKKLENIVDFLAAKSNDFVLKEIKGSRFCFMVSLTEMSPNFALECIGAGRPIVLTQENGVAPPLEGEGVLLVNPKDEKSISGGIKKMLDNNFYKKALKSMNNLEINYSWDDVAVAHKKEWRAHNII